MSGPVQDGRGMPFGEPPFSCPVCGLALFRQGGSLRCANAHAFDIARQGYVNLLRRRPSTLYADKALFVARRAVYEAGFFDPVAVALRAALPPAMRRGVLLDAGCGEGSMLERVTAGGVGGIGLDIARPAVQMAAAAYKRHAWCVGDVCAIPLPDASVDAVLNMLTPANHGEFARVLRPGGLLLKVVPGADHLREIRAMTGKPPAENESDKTRRIMARFFAVTDQKTVRYTFGTSPALAERVFVMTPLTAHEAPRGAFPPQVTVDVALFIGQKKA